MGTQFLSFKQAKMSLGELSHQSPGPGPASTSLTTSAESQEEKTSQDGHQSLTKAALAQEPSHLLMGCRTREQKKSTPLLSSGKSLKFSGTNPRHLPAVIYLLLEDTNVIPPASPRQRGEQGDSHSAPVLHREVESEPSWSSKPCSHVAGRATAARVTTETRDLQCV